MKKVISVVLNNFKNDSRVLKECISLQNNGYQVSVLALFDNNMGLPEYDIVDNVSVHRICLISKAWPNFFLIQIIKYLEFLIRALIESIHADIIHCNDLNALPVGVFCKVLSLGKIKIVYDAHELETEVEGLNGLIKLLFKIAERCLIYFADKIITVSESIANEYMKNYNIEKPVVILNVPSKSLIQANNIFRDKFGIPQTKKIFLYQGALSEGRGIRLIVQVFKQLKNEEIVLVLMGYGSLEKWVQEQADENDNIYFHEAVSPRNLLDYTASGDYGIVFLNGSESLSYYYALPNKLFEYSMCHKPTVFSALPEMLSVNKKYNFGISCEYEEKSFLKAICKILTADYKTMQLGAAQMANDYSWEIQEKKLIELYDKLL